MRHDSYFTWTRSGEGSGSYPLMPPINDAPLEQPNRSGSLRSVLGLPIGVHLLAWGGLLGLVLLLVGVTRAFDGQDIWRGWAESRGMRQPNYAERIYRENVFRTRANTWTNLGFVLVGFYVLGFAARDWQRRSAVRETRGYVEETPELSVLFGIASIYLGFGSGLFHASLTQWSQQLDVASMYAPLLAGIALHLGRWSRAARARWGRPHAPLWPWLATGVFIGSGLLYRYKWSMSSTRVLTTLILTVALLGLADLIFMRRQRRFRWLVFSTLALVAAVICRERDIAGKFSGPDTWLQGHAVWHLLTAASVACLYAYQRCEASFDPSPKKDPSRIRAPENRVSYQSFFAFTRIHRART